MPTQDLNLAIPPDMQQLRSYRLDRVRKQLQRHDMAGIVLFDPVNIRYATGSSNMQVWTLHNPSRYAFIGTDGPVILFDFQGARHLVRDLESIDEFRTATSWFYFVNGPRVAEMAKRWADEIAAVLRDCGGGPNRSCRCRLSECAGRFGARGTEHHGAGASHQIAD
jgi:Xaa-Pro aminopeptidase